MCRNSTEENKNRYEGMKKISKKVVSKTMREMADEGLSELKIVQIVCLY